MSRGKRKQIGSCNGRRAVIAVAMALFSTGLLAQSSSDKTIQSLAWTLGSRLSLAAVGYSEGAPQEVVDRMINSVRPVAKHFGADIPPLPEKSGRWAEDAAAVLKYLLGVVDEGVGKQIHARYPGEPAFLFEIAVKSNLLLFLYGPGDQVSTALVDVIRRLGPSTGVPQHLWLPVVDRVEAGAPFEQVKAAVVQMHDGIAKHLAAE